MSKIIWVILPPKMVSGFIRPLQECSYDETSPSTVMVWVLPIYRSEAEYIDRKGWKSFEDLLEEKDPDLCSMERDPVA